MTHNHKKARTAQLHEAFDTLDRDAALTFAVTELGYSKAGANSCFSHWAAQAKAAAAARSEKNKAKRARAKARKAAAAPKANDQEDREASESEDLSLVTL